MLREKARERLLRALDEALYELEGVGNDLRMHADQRAKRRLDRTLETLLFEVREAKHAANNCPGNYAPLEAPA